MEDAGFRGKNAKLNVRRYN